MEEDVDGLVRLEALPRTLTFAPFFAVALDSASIGVLATLVASAFGLAVATSFAHCCR